MREVSGRILEMFFREADKRGFPQRGLLRRAFARMISAAAAARELNEAHAKLLVLEGTVRDLQDSRVLRDRIFANVNHDIRTPLSNIMVAVSIIRSAPEAATSRSIGRALDTIERSASRQLRLVDDMLLLAESRELEINVRLGPCDLRGLVDDVLQAWAPIVQARGLELQVETKTPCCVNLDPNAMDRVLSNLLSNAVKFTPEGGRVEVRLTVHDERATLEVRDTGRGVDKELLPRLFGRFERGRAAVTGSGIGLSIVKELVEAQHGTIDVLAPEGGGAAFRVSWPILDRADVRQANARS